MTRFIIGDLSNGHKTVTLPDVISGDWTRRINDAEELSCTVTLKDPATRRMRLLHTAAVGKSYLAVVNGDKIEAAGPIWLHEWDDDRTRLTLIAAGLWSYFDHRVLLPPLNRRLPTDPSTDTRFMPTAPDDKEYPWPTDTRKSLQGICRALVAQAQQHTNGHVPVILPEEIPGTHQRDYRGTDVASVGERLRQLSAVRGGPNMRFAPRFTPDREHIEWVMLIGTPTQPLLASQQEQTFRYSVAESAVSKLKIRINGNDLASRTFASGGRMSDKALVSVSEDPTLTHQNFPLLEKVDASHSDVGNLETLQEYSDEMVLAGRRAQESWSFTHTAKSVYAEVGDFVRFSIHDHPYLDDGTHRLRIALISGDHHGTKLNIVCTPEIV